MDKGPSSTFPKLSTLFLVLVIGAFAGAGIYALQARGIIPLSKNITVSTPGGERVQQVVTEENAVIDVAQKSSPSVVSIGSTQRTSNPFDPFAAPQSQSSTIGTGFVVSDKGIIITNKHVVSDTGATYTVITRDDKKFEVRKIYRDPLLDLAIIQIDNGGLQALPLGDSSKLKVGQTAIAIGNALGQFTNTVTNGIISGLGRRVVAGDPYSGSAESLDNLIQTSAAINPGNSGGPLLNSAGQVIGVNVATTEGAQNISFAIPINSVKKIVDEFIQKGTVSRPFLGVSYRFIAKDIALLNDVPQGAYVQNVVRGSAADKAGVKAGDIILKIDGQVVDSDTKISETIASKQIGDTVTLTLWSDGNQRDTKATLQELPGQ